MFSKIKSLTNYLIGSLDKEITLKKKAEVIEANVSVESGKILTSSYEYAGIKLGEQKVERVPSLPKMMRILETRKAYLEQQKPKSELEQKIAAKEMSEIEAQIESCASAMRGESHIPPSIRNIMDKLQAALKNFQQKLTSHPSQQSGIIDSIQSIIKTLAHYKSQCKFDWIGSNYFRDCLTECEGLQHENPEIALECYQEASKKIIPSCVNLRRHEISANGEKATMIRTGIMSDMRNGYLSLDELVDFQKPNNRFLRDLKYHELDSLRRKLWAENKKSTPEYAVLTHACHQLKSEENLNMAVAQRRVFLQHQMLMLVLEHMQTLQEKGKLGESDEISMMHLSLLNRTTNSVDKTGWKKNEEVFMRDMAQIFKEFNGKNIIFDGQGPLVDKYGMIHLPQEYGVNQQKVVLKTLFANVSVQNHKVNDGAQAEINHLFFIHLRNIFGGSLPQEFLDIEKKIKQGKSNFDIAEQLASAALKYDILLSVGCLSAKDRTGWVCGRVGVSHVLENSCGALPEKEKGNLEQEWSREVLSGPALGVCVDCNLRAIEPQNVQALKLTELNLEGVGIVDRTNQYKKLVDMTLKPRSKKAMQAKIRAPKEEYKLIQEKDALDMQSVLSSAVSKTKKAVKKVHEYSPFDLPQRFTNYS